MATATKERTKQTRSSAPSGATSDGASAAKKAPPYGGVVGEPDLGANGRRVWKYVVEHHSKSDVARLQRAVVAATRKDDRFIRYQTIIAEAKRLGIEGIDETLARRLARQDKGGKNGLDRVKIA